LTGAPPVNKKERNVLHLNLKRLENLLLF
jgi:hypothetical protein